MSNAPFLKKAHLFFTAYCAAATLIAALSFAGQYSRLVLGHERLWGLIDFFNVDTEGNLPSWFSSTALLFSACLLGMIAGKADSRRVCWRALSWIFVYLSIDEGARIHDRLIDPMREQIPATGFLYYVWVVPAALLLILFAVCFLDFWRSLPAKPRGWMMAAGVVYVTGALGLEMVGGNAVSLSGREDLPYQAIVTLEEYLEMIGIGLMGYACALFYSRMAGRTANEVTASKEDV